MHSNLSGPLGWCLIWLLFGFGQAQPLSIRPFSWFFLDLAEVANFARNVSKSANSTANNPLENPIEFFALESDEIGENCTEKLLFVNETIPQFEKKCETVKVEHCTDVEHTKFNLTDFENCRDVYHKRCTIEHKKFIDVRNVTTCVDQFAEDCSLPKVKNCRDAYDIVCARESDFRPIEVCQENPLDPDCPESLRDIDCKIKTRLVCSESCQKIRLPKQKCVVTRKFIPKVVPQENCRLIPRRECALDLKFLPYLQKARGCVPVEKELCTQVELPPKISQKVVKVNVC